MAANAPLYDTHAHLDDPQLAANLDLIVSNARAAGLAGITAIGTTVESSLTCVEIAGRYDFVTAAVGIHPNQCSDAGEKDWARIVRLASDPSAVAIGETGLDRYWDYCPFDIQLEWFDRHIELSNETGKPLVVHMRECEADILSSLEKFAQNRPVNGIMHSFAGSQATADRCLEMGMHISFAGMVTFKKSGDLRAIAATIPDDRILVETDSPYLSPEPLRGKRPNEPARVEHTARCIADARGVSFEELAELTTANALRLFGLKADLCQA
ncbi:MAG: TatD family hydrolase [Planctomycetota bacterium]